MSDGRLGDYFVFCFDFFSLCLDICCNKILMLQKALSKNLKRFCENNNICVCDTWYFVFIYCICYYIIPMIQYLEVTSKELRRNKEDQNKGWPP